jgi:hypothetical protein
LISSKTEKLIKNYNKRDLKELSIITIIFQLATAFKNPVFKNESNG